MDVVESFTAHQIENILRKTFLFADDRVLNYHFIDKSVMAVQSEEFDQQYVLVKVPLDVETPRGTLINPMVIQPVFVVENDKKENFMAFDKQQLENFIVPERNNIEHLKTILKGLADYQAAFLVNNGNITSEYSIKNTAKISGTFDDANVADALKHLRSALDKLLKINLFVRSLWSFSINSVYVHKHSGGTKFIDLGAEAVVPPAFDALLYIFSLSDNSFRQQHFEGLVQHYFNSLKAALESAKHESSSIITRLYNEAQVRSLLPVIKFELASTGDFQLLANISNYLKYPLINQEDVNEVLRNYLQSTDYELVSYELVPLSEQNGHLGEYFHLNIKAVYQNVEQNVQVFAKFLITNTDFMTEFVQNGPGKKEDFFYNVLCPLYIENGLGSFLEFAPKCYLSRISWLIVLDDLSKEGYVGLKPNSILEYDGLSAVFRKLAKLHASSLILEDILSKKSGKQVRLDDDYAEYFEDAMLTFDESLKPMYDNTIETLQYIAEKFPEITDPLKLSPEELRQHLKDLYMTIFGQTKDSCKLRNVLNHGDMYVSNVLFSFDKENIIDKVVLIDFQLLRYIPPAFELLFFIFSSSTKKTRDSCHKQLLEEYYANISEDISKFDLDPDEVFPRDLFEENVQYAMPGSLSSAFNYGILIHIDSEFREQVLHDEKKMKLYVREHREELMKLFWDNDHYRTIMRGFLEDYVDLIRTRIIENPK